MSDSSFGCQTIQIESVKRQAHVLLIERWQTLPGLWCSYCLGCHWPSRLIYQPVREDSSTRSEGWKVEQWYWEVRGSEQWKGGVWCSLGDGMKSAKPHPFTDVRTDSHSSVTSSLYIIAVMLIQRVNCLVTLSPWNGLFIITGCHSYVCCTDTSCWWVTERVDVIHHPTTVQ